MQHSAFHLRCYGTSGKYTKSYITIRSAPGQKRVSFNYSCRMTSATEPHANEAESIPLTGHVRGAPITPENKPCLQLTPLLLLQLIYLKRSTLPCGSRWQTQNMWNWEFLASLTLWETPMMESSVPECLSSAAKIISDLSWGNVSFWH